MDDRQRDIDDLSKLIYAQIIAVRGKDFAYLDKRLAAGEASSAAKAYYEYIDDRIHPR